MKRKVFIWLGAGLVAAAVVAVGGWWGWQKLYDKPKEELPYRIFYTGRGRVEENKYNEGRYVATTKQELVDLYQKLPAIEPVEAPSELNMDEYTVVALVGDDKGLSTYELFGVFKGMPRPTAVINKTSCKSGSLGQRYIFVAAIPTKNELDFKVQTKTLDCNQQESPAT